VSAALGQFQPFADLDEVQSLWLIGELFDDEEDAQGRLHGRARVPVARSRVVVRPDLYRTHLVPEFALVNVRSQVQSLVNLSRSCLRVKDGGDYGATSAVSLTVCWLDASSNYAR
jgi:hypothetical protein